MIYKQGEAKKVTTTVLWVEKVAEPRNLILGLGVLYYIGNSRRGVKNM